MKKTFSPRGEIKNIRSKSPIEQYRYLEKIRDSLKNIQQLSYKITQFDKSFPLSTVQYGEYEDMLKGYLAYADELDKIKSEIETTLNES